MGCCESSAKPVVVVSWGRYGDSRHMEYYLKRAAALWTRIANEEGFQTAFVGVTAANYYGSDRQVSHLDIVVEREFGVEDNGKQLRDIIKDNKDVLVSMADSSIGIRVEENKVVAVQLHYSDPEPWASLIPTNSHDRRKYRIPTRAIPTYDDVDIGEYDPVPMLFAPNLLIAKLRGFGHMYSHAEKIAEAIDINAVARWMYNKNVRFGLSGLAQTELPQVRAYLNWCHSVSYQKCDLQVVNMWRKIGFDLNGQDVLDNTNGQQVTSVPTLQAAVAQPAWQIPVAVPGPPPFPVQNTNLIQPVVMWPAPEQVAPVVLPPPPPAPIAWVFLPHGPPPPGLILPPAPAPAPVPAPWNGPVFQIPPPPAPATAPAPFPFPPNNPPPHPWPIQQIPIPNSPTLGGPGPANVPPVAPGLGQQMQAEELLNAACTSLRFAF
jgi:hypothetical protein